MSRCPCCGAPEDDDYGSVVEAQTFVEWLETQDETRPAYTDLFAFWGSPLGEYVRSETTTPAGQGQVLEMLLPNVEREYPVLYHAINYGMGKTYADLQIVYAAENAAQLEAVT